MILTTLIILILIGCFINGHRRGLLMMALYTGTYLVSWMIAKWGARALGGGLSSLLPDVSQSAAYSTTVLKAVDNNAFFYNGIAVLGILSLIIGYVVIYVALVILQLWPAGWWQMQLANSGLAQFMINQTPALAQLVINTLK